MRLRISLSHFQSLLRYLNCFTCLILVSSIGSRFVGSFFLLSVMHYVVLLLMLLFLAFPSVTYVRVLEISFLCLILYCAICLSMLLRMWPPLLDPGRNCNSLRIAGHLSHSGLSYNIYRYSVVFRSFIFPRLVII